MCWVCAGMRGYARVYAGMRGYAWVCAGVHGCAGCAQLCAGVRRFAQEYACMCGMNFQNFFQRIESLHQRTLILHILYEFFALVISCLHLHEAALESCTMSI